MAASKLLHIFSTFAVGGPQVRFAAQANRFGDQFHHLIVAMDGQYDCQSRIDSAIEIEFPQIRIQKGHTLANILTFRRALRDLRPDLPVTYNWGSIEWALANWPHSTRHVHVEDGFGPEEAPKQFRRRIWIRRLALARSTLIVPSLNLRRIATRVWKLDPQRVRYIANGIDCDRFAAPHEANLLANWPGTGPVIGTVAA